MQSILREISSGMILDLIPIDLFLHALIGAIITIFALKQGKTHLFILLILILIAGLKELNDYAFHQFAGWEEYLSDFIITFFYFGMSYSVKNLKMFINNKTKVLKIKIK